MNAFNEDDLSLIEKYFHALIVERNAPNEHFYSVIKSKEYVLPTITNDNFEKQEECRWYAPILSVCNGGHRKFPRISKTHERRGVCSV